MTCPKAKIEKNVVFGINIQKDTLSEIPKNFYMIRNFINDVANSEINDKLKNLIIINKGNLTNLKQMFLYIGIHNNFV